MRLYKIGSSLIIMLLVGALFVIADGQVYALPLQQIAPTATFVQVSLPTPLPILPTNTIGANNVPIERTPTPEGGAYLEAITEANVRSEPDPEAERLGTIRSGDQYIVIGRYYRWYEFQFDQSASGKGWVFEELVNITGNTDRIPDLSVGTATPDIAAQQVSSTLALITQTPGGILTATAGVGAIPLPFETNSVNILPVDGSSTSNIVPLPTFTSPPNAPAANGSSESIAGAIPANAEEPSQAVDIVLPSSVPPILPILILGGAGILGLAISSSRR